MKTPISILALISLSIVIAYADESRLQIRLLKASGATPNDAMLRTLVEDPGAQAAPLVSQTFTDREDFKIREISIYRYATEYTPEGIPTAFETTELGWTGGATLISQDPDKFDLKLDLTNVRIGTPRIYEIEGVQFAMPVFTSIKASNQEMPLVRGEWAFFRASSPSESETIFWAVRVVE